MSFRVHLVIATGLLLYVFAIPTVAKAQMIIGHRGAAHDAPENTLAGFKLAWQQGADGIEGDFYLTADKQIVCIHDADTLRTGGVKHIVEQTTWEKLRSLDVGVWKGESYRGEMIPTFESVLATVPAGKTFVIELKTGPQIVPMLVKEIERLGPPLETLMIISFNAETIAQCKQSLPGVRAHWLTSFKEDSKGRIAPSPTTVLKSLAYCGADGVGLRGDRKVVDREFINTLVAGGCKEFHVWTIDDVDDAKFFQMLGSVAITTNRPGLIAQRLRGPGPDSPPSP